MTTYSTPNTALAGSLATVPRYCAAQASALDLVRFHTVTLCWAFVRWPAMGKPIAPSPRNATLAISQSSVRISHPDNNRIGGI